MIIIIMIIDPTVDEVDTLDRGPVKTFPHAEKDVLAASVALVQVAIQAAANDSLPSTTTARMFDLKLDHIRSGGRRRGR